MTTLLIDGDVIAYKAAASIERAINWGEGLWTLHSQEQEGIEAVEAMIEGYKERLGAKKHVIALTDQNANWRLRVWPSYKAHRKDVRKPLCLPQMREHLLANHQCYLRDNLEGDDILGILATHPTLVPGPKIIVSVDKDFYTIPGSFFRDVASATPMVEDVSPARAAYSHLYQTLIGDATDGYPGCPGVGPETARTALREGLVYESHQHTLSRGPRKGQVETRWEPGRKGTPWEVVVSLYQKAGLTEADALVQARVARILHHQDYDFIKKEPILWTP